MTDAAPERRETLEERRERVLWDYDGAERRAADRREADRVARLEAFAQKGEAA